MVARSRLQHEFAVAIGAFDEVLVAHLEIDLGMTERAAAPVAGDAGVVHFDDFWRFDGHGKSPDSEAGGDNSQQRPGCNRPLSIWLQKADGAFPYGDPAG